MDKLYYILDNDVVVYNEPQLNLQLLNEEQVQFHLNYPEANSQEVLRLQLDAEYNQSFEVRKTLLDIDIKIRLSDTDSIVSRYKDELELGETTKISADEYQRLLLYRKYLRDLSKNLEYPFVTIKDFE